MQVLGTGLGALEGPVTCRDGSLIVTSIDQGKLYRIADGRAQVFAITGGGPNGATEGEHGLIYVAQNGGAAPAKNEIPSAAGVQVVEHSGELRRFGDEMHRIYGVMNNRLYDRPYLAGDDYSIADMAAYPWTANWALQGIDLGEFRYFKRWFEALSARPAVQRGMAVTAGPAEDFSQLSPEERERRMKLLFNQRARPAPAQ